MASPAFSDTMTTEPSSPKGLPAPDFSIYNDLSPIKQVRGGIDLTEFIGLGSLVLNFTPAPTSPVESPHHEKSFLKSAELSQNDGNPVARASTSSADSANPSLSQAINVAEISGLSTDSKRAIEFDDGNDKGKDEGTEGQPPPNLSKIAEEALGKYEGTEGEPPPTLSKKAEEDLQGDPIQFHEPVKNEEQQRAQQPIDEEPNVYCLLHGNLEGQQHDYLCTQGCENISGIRKRCLQVDVDPQHFPQNRASSLDPTTKGNNSESPITAAESEGQESLSNFNAASSRGAKFTLFHSCSPFYPQPSVPPTNSCSSLHLSSINSNLQAQYDQILDLIPAVMQMGIKRIKLSPNSSCPLPENMTSCSNPLNVTSRGSFVAEDGRNNSNSPILTSSAPFEYPHQSERGDLSMPYGRHPAQHDMSRFCPKQVQSYECSQLTSNNTRANTLDTSENDGHIRCNCRKRACMQLYCACFAAGKNCTEACGCQGCHNRPENQVTIDKARLEILSRNPAAFTPKIVRYSAESNNEKDQNQATTTSSGKHVRGCNCKRSMCQNKYCECFKGNVGCSSGCQCIGCRNTHGKKEGLDHALRGDISYPS